MRETAGRLVASAGAATISQVWRIGVTFATHMILRRLIPPEEMGVWVWAEPVFLILAQVRDLGVPAHIVRDPERPWGNFLGLQAAWGGLFALAVLAAAPLLALAYADHDAEAVSILRVLCLFLFVQGLGSVPLTFFEAELEVVKTIPAEIVRNLTFVVLSLTLASLGHGVWSIVIAHVTAGVVYAIVLWWKAWPRMRLDWIPHKTFPLLLTSYPLAVMSLLEQVVLRLDAFVLGLRFRAEVVGTAGLAIFVVLFFSRHLADPIGRALYPALVRYRAEPRRAFEAYRVATLFLLSFAVPTAFFLCANAVFASRLLGGEKWVGAADYLRVLSLVPLARPWSMFGLEFLLTQHRDRLLIFATLTNLVSLGGLGLWLTRGELGAVGMAVASYFAVGSQILAWGIYRVNRSGFRGLVVDILGLYAAGAALFVPILLLTEPDTWLRLGCSCLAGLLVLGYAWHRFGASFGRFLRGEP